MTENKVFVDSNVLLYLLSGSDDKADKVEALLSYGSLISVQVLNEITSVARRKLGMSWAEVDEFVGTIQKLCEVEPLTAETHNFGRELASRHQLAVYDGFIVAAAVLADCDILYTEDMHHGAVLDKKLRIRNPFIA